MSGYPVQAYVAYAPTHTNYFGATSCGLSSVVRPTTSAIGQISSNVAPSLSAAKCTLPASISGKAYSVVPVIWVPRTVSSTLRHVPYDCDPIPVASLNAGNFKFACPDLPGKSIGSGRHTINWIAPSGGVSIVPFTFWAIPPTTTPKYVVNPTLAKTSIVPTTIVPFTATTSSTRTLPQSTSIIPIATGTSTCTVTVVATRTAVPAIKGTREIDAVHVANAPQPGSDVPRELADTDGLLLAETESNTLSFDADGITSEIHDDALLADAAPLRPKRAAAPTIGRPDFTYPPYGETTVYVNSISTSICTHLYVSAFTVTPPVLTKTVSYEAYTFVTVTVTTVKPA